MPIDTHAAVRKLENGGFETEQAEALVEVINGVAGEQATKEDLKVVREDIKVLREDFKGDLKELREDFKGDIKVLREDFKGDIKVLQEDFKGDLKELREDFKGDIKVLREDFKGDLKELREDFKDQFATKADFAKLETKIETVSNRMLFALIAVAGLLFAALRLWP